MTLNVRNFLIIVGVLAFLESVRGYFKKGENRKKYVVREIALGVPILLLLLLFGPLILLSPLKPGFASLSSEKVTVYYPASQPAQGEELLAISQRAVETNERFYRIPVKTKVILAATKFDMFRLSGNPTAGGTGTDLGVTVRYDKANEGIITHELSHDTLPKMTGRSGHFFPRWFDEGLASYLGKMDYYRGIPELKESLQEGSYKRDLERWDGLKGRINWTLVDVRCCARQIYGQTYQMIKFLFDKYGEDQVYQLLLASKEMPFDQAFRDTFGVTVDEYHQEFINFLEIKN